MGFLMNIVDHGTWSLYTPEVWPVGIPQNIVFCKCDIDGVDWYDFQRVGDLSHESVKAVCFNENGNWIVRIAVVDGSRLFPEGRRVIEIYDGDLEDPQATYEGLMYDPVTNTLAAAPVIVIVPTEASKLGLRRVFVEMGVWDQVKAHIAADAETQEEWDLATVIKRTDTLTQKIIFVMQLSPAQVDAILIRAKQLVS
jgi:hypothetical protein